jgi:hypothetical protein
METDGNGTLFFGYLRGSVVNGGVIGFAANWAGCKPAAD